MKKLIKVILMLTIFVNISLKLNGQTETSRIVFEYTKNSEMNPKYSDIKIVIQQNHEDVTLNLLWKSMGPIARAEMERYRRELLMSKTKEDSIKVIENKPVINKGENTYKIDLEQYKKIAEAIYNIDAAKVLNSGGGYDGYRCSIQFGGYGNYIKYDLHSPGHNSKRGKNPNFSEACKLILEAAGIKPRKVL